MDAWVLLVLSITLLLVLKVLIFNSKTTKKPLPPGPLSLPIIGSIVLLGKPLYNLEPILRRLRTQYGPIVTVYIGSRPLIFISDRTLALQALVHKGATFADRPPPLPHDRVLSSNQHNINSAAYGPLWRLFRRNIASEVLHPSRIKQFAPTRDSVLRELTRKLRVLADGGKPVTVIDSFHDAMFCLLVVMCFGGKPDETIIKQIEDIQRYLLTSFNKFAVFAFLPRITKVLFRKTWGELLAIRKKQEDIFIPLIRARREKESSDVCSYVDSLLGLRIEEGRELTEKEIVGLCSEFLAAGTDTTTTALQWVIANLVKRPDVQGKLAGEIIRVVGKEPIKEEDLQRMVYLKAVILEALRRHPPAHFVLPHAVTEEVEIGGYVIPKNASINFMVAEMNNDGEEWEDPMEFKPERFLAGGEAEGVDITGSREIKMMPFGAGRRICPGLGIAMLHLEYFVANLVREFEWVAVQGEEVDLTEKLEFTVVMQNPLRARIIPRTSE